MIQDLNAYQKKRSEKNLELVRSKLKIIEEVINEEFQSELPNPFLNRICNEVGLKNITLKKYLKQLDNSLFQKLEHLIKSNNCKHRKIPYEMIQTILKMSKEGKGIDTIAALLGYDSETILETLKKYLSKEEYTKRRPKGRKGGNFGTVYELPDGRKVQSLYEFEIARLLTDAAIEFEVQKPIYYNGHNNKYVDFYLPSFDLYIEFAGMIGYHFYDNQVLEKINLYRSLKINYVYLYSIREAKELILFLTKRKNLSDIVDEVTTLTIPISKDNVFHTIQGEGISAGRPSVFMRLSYCNLHCQWCDSYYTWKPEYVNNLEKAIFKTLAIIASEIETIQLGNANCYRIVVTGGEPLLFKKQLEVFVYFMLTKGYRIEIETNGTISPSSFLLSFCSFNVSPKLSNNTADAEKKRIVPTAFKLFAKNKNTIFKFVVSSIRNEKEIQLLQQIYGINYSKIFVMPEGVTSDELNKSAPLCINMAIKNNWSYSDRLHVRIFGPKRGV